MEALMWCFFHRVCLCVARFGQQVHGLVLSEYADSEESGDEDSQSSKVNRKSNEVLKVQL